MSGKFSKKAKSKQAAKRGKQPEKSSGWWIGPGILLVLVLIAVIFLATMTEGEGGPIPEETTLPVEIETEAPAETKAQVAEIEDVQLYVGNGLMVTDMGKYTGVYMEDGSDEIVTGVTMIVVNNMSDSDIQYAKITMTAESGETAGFSVSTLPAGESAVLLEENRFPYDRNLVFSQGTSENIALFNEPLTLREESLKIQAFEGALNITNISGEDITGDIVIYYKNSSADLLYGGITYRVRIEGGLKADELRQLMPAHFTAEGSRIMFVTVG